jgi:transaldolase
LLRLGIDLMEVSTQLETDGIDKFVKPFASLHRALAEKRG